MLGVPWVQHMSSLLYLTFFLLNSQLPPWISLLLSLPSSGLLHYFICNLSPALLSISSVAFSLICAHFLCNEWTVRYWSEVKVAQSCPTLWDSMDYLVLQARILEWVAFPFSRGIFPTQGSNPGLRCCRQILYPLSHKGSPRVGNWSG